MVPGIIDWDRGLSMIVAPAGISASNEELWTVVLVLGIVVLVLWILSWFIGRRG